jgi:hypothetical protein
MREETIHLGNWSSSILLKSRNAYRTVKHEHGQVVKTHNSFEFHCKYSLTKPLLNLSLHFTYVLFFNHNRFMSSGRHPYGLGGCRPGKLRGTAVPPQTNLGQSSIAPWTDWPPPGKKRETE